MDMRMPETCWTVFKRQAIKLRDWCICGWLIYLTIFLFCGHNILTEGVFVTQMSSNAGTPFWRNVWVKTDCCFVNENVFSIERDYVAVWFIQREAKIFCYRWWTYEQNLMLTGLISCFMLKQLTSHHVLKETNILRHAYLDATLRAVSRARQFSSFYL